MKKKFTENELNLLSKGKELRSEDIAAILGRSVNSCRIKLSKMGNSFNPPVLDKNRSLKDIKIEKRDQKYYVQVGEIVGTLKIIYV
jgi:hypothetical protein